MNKTSIWDLHLGPFLGVIEKTLGKGDMKRKMIGGMLCCASIFYHASWASDKSIEKTQISPSHSPSHGEMLSQYDINGDGVVSVWEFNFVAEKQFEQMDKNHDGVLNRQDAYLRQRSSGKTIDWNNDGKIDKQDQELERKMWENIELEKSKGKSYFKSYHRQKSQR